MPKKRSTGEVPLDHANPSLTPLRRSRRFNVNHAGPASSNPFSSSFGKSQVPLQSHQIPRETPSTEVKKTRETKYENTRRRCASKGGYGNAEAPRRSTRLNHGHEDVPDMGAEKISQVQKTDGVKDVKCQRGRPRHSSLGMATVSYSENKEGELKTGLLRSNLLNDAAEDRMNSIQSSEVDVEVGRDMDTPETRTPKRNDRRKRGQKEEAEEKQKLKNMAKPAIESCRRKTKKPRTDPNIVMVNKGEKVLVHRQDTSLCGNGKAIVGCGTKKEGKNILDWTNEQDKELHRAYIIARPSPHFWKNVSKMVPGKSAKECFNRIHSYLTTPPVPPPRAKMKKSEQSPIGSFSLSGGSSSGRFKENIKKTRSTKQKKVLAQKTVRHILKKQSLQEQARETDLFPVFQSSLNMSTEELPSICMSPTPACQLKFSDSPKSGSANSMTAKKTLSRVAKISSMKPSPEVLKQVKNLALHERYIDRLHGRVSSWKPSSKLSVSETHGKESKMPKTVPIKDAKNALLFDAIEAMRQFWRSEDLATSCANLDDDNDEDGGDESNESGSEDI